MFEVEYWVADYHGTVRVVAGEDAEREHVVALAKRQIFRHGPPAPMYYERYEVSHAE
jgi:hypothetical protein